MANVFVAVIPTKAGIQLFSGFRVAFHLPGMTILLPKMSNFATPPATPGWPKFGWKLTTIYNPCQDFSPIFFSQNYLEIFL